MKKMKKFLIYALLIAALWIFSDMIIYLSTTGKNKPVDNNQYINSQEVNKI